MTPSRSGRSALGSHDEARDFGVVNWISGAVRRRWGLAVYRRLHPRVSFGRRCDIRRGVRIRVARGASVGFGANCVLDEGLVAECRGRLLVGDGTVFGHHCTLAAAESIEIGRDCLIAELVSIRDHDHQFSSTAVSILNQGRRVEPVSIGQGVWLGAKVTVTPGVTIGDGCVVGANSVVSRDLPPFSVAVGAPARVIRTRGDENLEHRPTPGG